jgi:hypothetical protein
MSVQHEGVICLGPARMSHSDPPEQFICLFLGKSGWAATKGPYLQDHLKTLVTTKGQEMENLILLE